MWLNSSRPSRVGAITYNAHRLGLKLTSDDQLQEDTSSFLDMETQDYLAARRIVDGMSEGKQGSPIVSFMQQNFLSDLESQIKYRYIYLQDLYEMKHSMLIFMGLIDACIDDFDNVLK